LLPQLDKLEVEMEPTYNFPVLRGIQAGREYYLAMCPLKLVSKIFLYDEEVVPPELRAQRTLNKARIPEIANYITHNLHDYVFSAITASIDSEAIFTPLDESGDKRNVGWLSIPMEATIIVNDGQHRRAAIEEAIKERPELADESIAVVFFIDAGLKKSQQMFADLNKHAVRPSRSLGILYDHRDPLAELARYLTYMVPVFKDLTEKEKTSISNRSAKLFTLSSIYQATQELLRKNKNEQVVEDEKELAVEFWTELGKVIPEWEMASQRQVSCGSLREGYIHAHGVALQALGIAGAELVSKHPSDWKRHLQVLKAIDWSRSNTEVWEGRAMLHGRINRAKPQVILTANYLKSVLGLSLKVDEQKIEDKYLRDKVGTL
jgi:DNA sulfur modification protein DndB